MERYNARKVIVDGRDTGDEKRLLSLLTVVQKMLIDPKPETLREIEALVEATELDMMRVSAYWNRTENESKVEKERLSKIREEKENIMKLEALAREQLTRARKIRKHSMKYLVMVRKIRQLPTRKRTHKHLEKVHNELQNLYVNQKHLESKITARRNHVLFMQSAFVHMAEIYNEGDDDDDGPPSKKARIDKVPSTPSQDDSSRPRYRHTHSIDRNRHYHSSKPRRSDNFGHRRETEKRPRR